MERAIEAFDSAVEQARQALGRECTNTLRSLMEANVAGEFEFLLHDTGDLHNIYGYKDGRVYKERYIDGPREEIEVEQVPFDQIEHGQLRMVAQSLNDSGSAYRAIASRAVS